ncbi:MAG: ABC transporter permease [Verrucomicrobia bacterium]|nr:MAG: ABC transporter permease [Verrucomicrobiota bacterium]
MPNSKTPALAHWSLELGVSLELGAWCLVFYSGRSPVKPPFRGFTAILYKEFHVVLRDPLTLFFMFFPPLIEMIAFGYALDNDVKHMAMIVFNEDRTVESRQIIDRFVNTQTFRVVGEARSVAELAAAIRQGKAYVGLQIPPNFTRDLRAGRNAQVQMLIDGSSSTIASSALNTALGVSFRESVFRLLAEAGRRELPMEVRPQILYNPAMRSPNFFVPGVIGVVLQIATTFATAMSLVRERERGTLEQLLVSPLSRWGLMLGKIVPYLCIGMLMASGLIAVMHWLFDVPIAGSLTALFAAIVIYIFCLLSLGLLVSTRAQNQIQALQMSMVFIMPSVFFSGFIFPRETMPWIFYGIGALLPTTYFIELARAIILRGASLTDFWQHLVILAAMGLALFTLCALRFKQKIA